jgi:YD repeat-containing protein
VDANGVTSTIVYDNLDRVISRSFTGGGAEGFLYSARGLIAYTNQLGQVTRYGLDALGRKVAETNANSQVTRYTYSPAGDLVMLVDPKGKPIDGPLTSMVDSRASLTPQARLRRATTTIRKADLQTDGRYVGGTPTLRTMKTGIAWMDHMVRKLMTSSIV